MIDFVIIYSVQSLSSIVADSHLMISANNVFLVSALQCVCSHLHKLFLFLLLELERVSHLTFIFIILNLVVVE